MQILPCFLPAFLNLGGGEVFFIVLIVLLFFGAKRIPELAKGLGKGIREMKDAMGGVETEIRREMNFLDREPEGKGKPGHFLPTEIKTESEKPEGKEADKTPEK